MNNRDNPTDRFMLDMFREILDNRAKGASRMHFWTIEWVVSRALYDRLKQMMPVDLESRQSMALCRQAGKVLSRTGASIKMRMNNFANRDAEMTRRTGQKFLYGGGEMTGFFYHMPEFHPKFYREALKEAAKILPLEGII